ncbi:putative membrane protein with YD repeats [Desulfosarcina variabilis str. Montpellier]|uniref:NHL domain-containing protein n=1 Tax=Desulfosarcina variabilis TaxID=2300 RepID=UPI003AFB6C26
MSRNLFFYLAVCVVSLTSITALSANDQIVFGPESLQISRWHMHFSNHVFSVDDPGDGSITVTKNTPDKEINGGFVLFNGRYISLGSFFKGDEITYQKACLPKARNRIVVFLRGKPGASVSILVSQAGGTVIQPRVTFSADPDTILSGESATLTWETSDAESVGIDNGIGEVDTNGSTDVFPTETTTYTMTATGPGGTTTAAVTVMVNYPPAVSISAGAISILAGESTTLSWTSSYSDSCVIEPDIGSVAPEGSVSVSPNETTIYTITASGSGWTITDEVTITVYNPPTVSLSVSPQTITYGEPTTLSWDSSDADAASIDQEIGSVDITGSITVTPEGTTTYTITVTGPGGTASAQAMVMVKSVVDPQPDGSFGQQYEDLIPPDAIIEAYDSKRFSVITGLVQDAFDLPIAGVSVTIHGHSQYGTATTDDQGRFSIPVEGGSVMTVVYQKDGLITSHRQVNVPWNDIAIAETIQMIPQDTVATTVVFDGNADTVVTHRSTLVSDEFGSRSTTVIFTGDNRAWLVDENGNDIQELTTITTRATEFVTPESMPAKLPPNSAFTYCVEFSVDEAQRVRFDKPVVTYVDNFLGFDVGEVVPVGYYDRDHGVWVPADNGIVVRLLDTDSDGVIDALDSDGDDQPNDLDKDGRYHNEVIGLNNKNVYQPNSTFWRILASHFTPWDGNFSPGLPAPAMIPNPKGEPDIDQELEEDCLTFTGSFVEDRSRIFHEDVYLPGTDIELHYESNRVEGYKTIVSVPASGDKIQSFIQRIHVKVELAGRRFEKELETLPNQKTQFIWDGLDYLGRIVRGRTIAHISVGFAYKYNYSGASTTTTKAFAQAGNEITDIPARKEMVLWKHNELLVDCKYGGENDIAKGWTLSSYHQVSPTNPNLLKKGDGTILKNSIRIIETVAGNGAVGYGICDDVNPSIFSIAAITGELPEGGEEDASDDDLCGDGSLATDASLFFPEAVAVDSAGNVFIADTENNRVRKVHCSNGIITTVAGVGAEENSEGEGFPTDNTLSRPIGMATDSLGNLFIADSENHRVRKLDINGNITTIAGNGSPGFSGDDGPATNSGLCSPHGVAVDNVGNLYIADSCNHRIRKVDPSGCITTIAGNGEGNFGGDGGFAIEANLYFPRSVVVDHDGNLFIADSSNNRIRKVTPSGIIITVAGTGEAGYSGDNDPAITAKLNDPRGITVDSVGSLFIADSNNQCIRKVDANGIISTVAGTGSWGFYGDGGIAINAGLYQPFGVAIDSAGSLFIADTNNSRVRKICPPSIFEASLNIGDVPFAEKSGIGHIISISGLHQSTIDLDNGVTLREFEYDENDHLISIADQFGNQITINRFGDGTPSSIISPDGLTTKLTINSDNDLTHITYPDGSAYEFEYTNDGLLLAKVEPGRNRFEHQYDESGRLTDATDDEGGHWRYKRTAQENGAVLTEVLTGEGNLTTYLDKSYSWGAYNSTITQPTGAQTVFSRTGDGLKVNKSLPCGMDLYFKYDLDSEYKFKFVKEMTETTPSGLSRVTQKDKSYEDTDFDEVSDLITETVSINYKSITIQNDILQSQRTISSPVGRTVTINYDADNLLTNSISIPNLFDTEYGYDNRGRLTSILTNARQIRFTYDNEGNIETITDPRGSTTTYGYDSVGRLTAAYRPDFSNIFFSYDGNGNMTVLTNPSDVSHGFGFNGVNLTKSYQTPISGSYSYLYDADRRLIQTKFPSGKQLFNVYDTTRLMQVQTPEGNIDYSYLCGTKINSITSGFQSITYEYDGKLVTSEIISGTLSQTLAYEYNNDFAVADFAYAGDSASYEYDNDGLLTSAGAYTITRNAGNGLPEAITGNSLTIDRTFNGYGELDGQTVNVSGNTIVQWTVTRDNSGRIIQKTEAVDGITANYDYSYDLMGRLVTVNKDGALVENYTYDLNGTRISETNTLKGINSRSLSYSDEDHLLTAGSASYQYDLDGFLTSKTAGSDVTTYRYSLRGELLQVNLPDGSVVIYDHDPLGRRIAKRIDGIIVEKYLWQGMTRLLAVYDGSDNLIQRFEYADARIPVAMIQGGVTYYLAYDQVGSLRTVTDGSGNVVKRIDYDSFGNILADTDSSFAIPFGFAGGLHDRDTGLVRFGYRDYDPDTGRWTAKDPIGFAGGDTDLFGYAQNDPVNSIDPFGLVDFGQALRSGSALIGNSLGVIGGAVFAVGTGGTGAVLGGVVVFKSSYAATANFRNLTAALQDEGPVSRGAFLNDIADIAAPCNETAQQLATITDLTIDLMSIRASRMATVPHRYNEFGYRLLEGGGKFGNTYWGNADQYLNSLGSINAADALLQNTPYN